ncbi:integral membrane protein [Colletotrichum musicola]|uniref:Integral membrane protein n=1 Tax=Colletotrichum musicola TaxID=2175873 RepID=A0A8H6KFV0_9PEZI|nr:integral membrane protein [Colletotrichum musicola]
MGHLREILTMSTALLQRDEALPPDENVGPISVALAAVLTALLIITTGLRIWVRAANRKLGWDDWTILLAAATCIARFAIVVKQAEHGNGRHRVYLSEWDYMMVNMYGWWGQVLLFLAVAFLKVSICLLILRIKDTKALKIMLYILMAGVLVTNLGVVIILIAECQPVGFWRGASAKCWPTQIRIYAIYATIAYSALTDLICSLLPLAVVWNVNMPRMTKFSISLLMGLGLVATGFGVARAASLGISTTDLSWAYCIAGIWSNLELYLGVIAANLALTRSIWAHFFGNGGGGGAHAIPGSTGRTNPSESGYLNSKLRGDRFEVPATMIRSSRSRGGSDTRGSDSDIPLEPGIQKKTEFWWTDVDEDGNRPTSSRPGSSREALRN